MAIDPADRYESMTDFIQDVEALTAAAADAPVGIVDPDQSLDLPGSAPRVLIVEPSKLTAKVFADVFRKSGCQDVHCAELAAEALSYAANHRPDVVIATRQLRDFCGEGLLQKIRSLIASTDSVVVLMSSDSPHELKTCSEISDAVIFGRKQAPADILKAIYCCTDFSFPTLPPARADKDDACVTVISDDGIIPPQLVKLLQNCAAPHVVATPKDMSVRMTDVDKVTRVDNERLIVWLDRLPDLCADPDKHPEDPMDELLGKHSTLADVDTSNSELRLRGVQCEAFIGSCNRVFDRGRLQRLLASA